MLTTSNFGNATQKIAFYGVVPPPYTGQTILTAHALSVLNDFVEVDKYSYAPLRLRFSLSPLIKLVLLGVKASRYKSVYLVLSSTRPWRNLFVLFTLRLRGLSVVGHVHSSQFGFKFLDKLAIGLLTKCIFLDELLLPSNCAKNRVEIVPNTISEIFDSVKRNEIEGLSLLRYTEKRLIFISNLWPDKGIGDLLSLMDSIDRTYSLVVIGELTAETEDSVIERLSTKDNVTFLGPITDREDILSNLLSSSAFVFPTRYRFEAQPLVILEALSTGLPVVCNGIGSIPNMVESGVSGFVHSKFDVQAYIESIESIFKNYESYLKFSIHAYNDYRSKYSNEIFKNNLFNVLG